MRYIIECDGERIPVADATPQGAPAAGEDGRVWQGFVLVTGDEHSWTMAGGRLLRDGTDMLGRATIGLPGPQDDPVIASLYDFDA